VLCDKPVVVRASMRLALELRYGTHVHSPVKKNKKLSCLRMGLTRGIHSCDLCSDITACIGRMLLLCCDATK